jgi:dTMP kinase
MFITFEGPDGGGKTTQIGLLAAVLEARGVAVVRTREPGGDFVGERVREILLRAAPEESPLTPEAELFLFAAARAQNVAGVVRPALRAGKVVLCDRFTDSTVAYQGFGRGWPLEVVRQVNQIAAGGLAPDRTFLLDIAPEAGLARQGEGDKDRLDRESLEFHQRVRSGFLSIAGAEPNRVVVIDASRAPQSVATEILERTLEALGMRG